MFKALLCFVVAGASFLVAAELNSQRDFAFNMLEANLVCIGGMQGELNELNETIAIKNAVLAQQQKHMDGQRKVIDRLSEMLLETREQLKKAHGINVVSQSNVRNLEKIVSEATIRIDTLKKQIEELNKKEVKIIYGR